jgi:hypothetical protein
VTDSIDQLVASGRLREAGLALARRIPEGESTLRDEFLVWQAALSDVQALERQATISPRQLAQRRQRLAKQLLQLARACDDLAVLVGGKRVETSLAAPALSCSVFLSYNHGDRDSAEAVAHYLRTAGIALTVDSQNMVPGGSIAAFIRESIQRTEATVCIVSAASLLSGWVCRETVLALGLQELWGGRRFIACTLDQRFLEARFRLEATQEIDRRLAEIESLLPSYAEQHLDSNDLNDEKSRLHELRHHLGTVLAHLRSSLCLDIRDHVRAASLERLADALRTTDNAGTSRIKT